MFKDRAEIKSVKPAAKGEDIRMAVSADGSLPWSHLCLAALLSQWAAAARAGGNLNGQPQEKKSLLGGTALLSDGSHPYEQSDYFSSPGIFSQFNCICGPYRDVCALSL